VYVCMCMCVCVTCRYVFFCASERAKESWPYEHGLISYSFPSLSIISLRRFLFCLARCNCRLFRSFRSDAPEAYIAM